MKNVIAVLIAVASLTAAKPPVKESRAELRNPPLTPLQKSLAVAVKRVNPKLDSDGIARAASRTTIPKNTIARGIVESRLIPSAVGSSGEKGMYQVIDSVWSKSCGDTPADPVAQTYHQDCIFRSSLRQAKGDEVTALSYYNAGRVSSKGKAYAAKVMHEKKKI